MAKVPGLRSPSAKVGGIVYFGRMLDKMRLHAQGKLPADYVPNLGDINGMVFDGRCCRFLGIRYDELKQQVLEGGLSDEQALAWCEGHGTRRGDFDRELWNAYLSKLGWRDEVSERLAKRIAEYGLQGRGIETYFDLFDQDEE